MADCLAPNQTNRIPIPTNTPSSTKGSLRLTSEICPAIHPKGEVTIKTVTLVESNPPTEFRERDLPAWRIDLADEDNTHIWVDAMTGRVAARRNDAWRRFDFFWMLHTMDYRGRDDFNHPLLIVVACLGLVTLGSGAFLWGLRLARRRRKRSG